VNVPRLLQGLPSAAVAAAAEAARLRVELCRWGGALARDGGRRGVGVSWRGGMEEGAGGGG
jgi:hypothetical protein